MSYWKWRETKQEPSRATSGHQISCWLVFLHFLCEILAPITVYEHKYRAIGPVLGSSTSRNIARFAFKRRVQQQSKRFIFSQGDLVSKVEWGKRRGEAPFQFAPPHACLIYRVMGQDPARKCIWLKLLLSVWIMLDHPFNLKAGREGERFNETLTVYFYCLMKTMKKRTLTDSIGVL